MLNRRRSARPVAVPGDERKRRGAWPAPLRLVLPVTLAGALILGACSSGSQSVAGGSTGSSGVPKAGGALTVALASAFHPIDPLSLATQDDDTIGLAVFGSLLTHAPDGSLVPDLATGYKVGDSNKQFTITLRKGVTFQDGTPFNAAAVAFNLRRDAAPSSGCFCLGDSKNIASVQTSSTDSVTVTLQRPDAAFPDLLAGPVGMMASPAAVKKEGKQFGLAPVGAGPFKFQSEVPGSSISFTKFDGYWDQPKPYLDAVTFKVITDDNSRFASLESGVIQVDSVLLPTQITAAKSSSNLQVASLGGLGTSFVMFNSKAAPFTNLLAREAVTFATNPQQINKALYDGTYSMVESPWPQQSWAYPGAIVPGYPSYNLAEAKKLVSQLGGLSFTFEVVNTATQLALAQALQSQWAAAGIKVKLRPTEITKLIADAKAGTFQAEWFRWQGSYDPDGNVYSFFLSTSPTNAARLSDPVVDHLLAQERAGTSPAARKPIFKQLAIQLAKDDVYDYLGATDQFRASDKTVHGIPTLANGWVDLSGAWMNGLLTAKVKR